MFSLCYVSELKPDIDDSEVFQLADLATGFGQSAHVTGYLSWNRSMLFQYLEGEKSEVQRLMASIEKDQRHAVIRKLELKQSSDRRFEDWYFRRLLGEDNHDISLSDLLENVMRSMATPLFEESRISQLVINLLGKLSRNKNVEHRLFADESVNSIDDNAPTVFGIGASAGGLVHIQDLLEQVPTQLNAAFVVVQHLSPDYETLLDVILQRKTSMNVLEAEHGAKLEAGMVYLIPRGMDLRISDGCFVLSEQDRVNESLQLPINKFFTSLAQEYGPKAIGIILSGTGTDGTHGARAIYEAGGIVIAQTPGTAEFDGMPTSVIDSGSVHQVLSPDAIVEQIIQIAQVATSNSSRTSLLSVSSLIDQIIQGLTDEKVDFSHYKKESIYRSIERRRILLACDSFEQYLSLLESTPKEKLKLRNDLLISVTSFFRDDDAWTELESEIIPKIASGLPNGDVIRVWVAGCATGEEAYSIAMLLSEFIAKSGRDLEYKIYATDLSDEAVSIAAAGVYSETVVQPLSNDRRDRFFKRTESGYLISKDIRERVIVAAHNMVKDTPFTRINLVSCRNVLIYMQPALQQQALKVLHYSLSVGGVLFLGASESIGSMQSEFGTRNREWNIFEKTRESRLPLHLNSNMLHNAGSKTFVRKKVLAKPKVRNLHQEMMQMLAVSMQKTMLLVNDSRKVLMVGADPKGLLHVKTGEPSNDVSDMVIDGLGPTLTIAIQHSLQDHKTVRYSGLRCRDKQLDTVRLIDLEVTPNELDDDEHGQSLLIVLGESPSDVGPSAEMPSNLRMIVDSTQQQLDETREALQSTIQELEISDVQGQTANEQLVSANEELQSTNEELQSVNEELYTVNFEYQSKIHELSDLTHDLDNLLDSTNIGVIFLDSELKIRRYTARAAEVINILPQDVGRDFVDLANTLDFPDLDESIRRVKSLCEPHERDIKYKGDVARLHVGIHPYRVGTDLTQGVIITFLDLGDIKSYSPMFVQPEKELA